MNKKGRESKMRGKSGLLKLLLDAPVVTHFNFINKLIEY